MTPRPCPTVDHVLFDRCGPPVAIGADLGPREGALGERLRSTASCSMGRVVPRCRWGASRPCSATTTADARASVCLAAALGVRWRGDQQLVVLQHQAHAPADEATHGCGHLRRSARLASDATATSEVGCHGGPSGPDLGRRPTERLGLAIGRRPDGASHTGRGRRCLQHRRAMSSERRHTGPAGTRSRRPWMSWACSPPTAPACGEGGLRRGRRAGSTSMGFLSLARGSSAARSHKRMRVHPADPIHVVC